MRFRLITTLGIAAGLGLTGVSSAVAVPHSSTTVSASSAHSVIRLAAITANPQGNIPAVLGSLGSKHYPSLYGGLVEVDKGRHIDVYLTHLRQSAEAAFTACRSCQPRRPGDLTFIKTAHSLRYLNALHQRVIATSHSLMRRGVRLTEWWPQIQDAREMIGVRGLTRAQAALLNHTFGTRNIQVFNVPPSQVPVLTSGRTRDSSPWKGGDAISDFTYGCTSAFAVTVGGKDRLVTAAHCFTVGESIHNYNVISGGSGNLIGTVSARKTSSGTVDAEIISATSTGYVWTGIPTATTKIPINGTATNTVGAAVYNDGAYSGETDTLHVVAINECISPTGFREECHIVHAFSSSSGVIASQDGDSGGPVISPTTSGKIYAAGVVSASTTGDTVPCQYNKPDTCYSDLYYSDMKSVLSEFSATLKTG